MTKIKRILCPTDLSNKSDLALRYAVALARTYEAKLYLCYCVCTPAWADATAEQRVPAPKRLNVEGLFAQSLEQYFNPAEPELDWEGLVVGCEDVPAAIVQEAGLRGVDLIVMCSRRRPYAAALLGSVAESVCRTAPCPILVMHPDERDWVDETAQTIDLRRILVAHDFSDYSELALQTGISFAQEYQSELHLLHVLPATRRQGPELAWDTSAESPYHKAARRLQRAVPSESSLWCPQIMTSVQEGQPYREILAYGEDKEIDLICMGAHGVNFGAKALFGSNVDRVLRQAGCPVLVARPLRPSP